MVTIVWNPTGFPVIYILLRGYNFDSSSPQRETLGPPIVRADNARLPTAAASQEFMEENGTTRVPHPPYSPDWAPSDFDLLGHVKRCLRGQPFETPDKPWFGIEAVQKPTLTEVSLDWMQRFRQCMAIMVATLKKPKKVSRAKPFLVGRYRNGNREWNTRIDPPPRTEIAKMPQNPAAAPGDL
jgi:transposase